MAIQVQGNGGTVVEADGTNFRALRVTGKPQDPGSLGVYSIGLTTGVLPAALAANSEIMQFRFASASNLVVLRSVIVSAAVSTTAFVAGVPPTLELRIARSWTGQGTLGTGITFGTNDSKKRTSFPTTLMAAGDVRVATTAALGVGTKTLDGTALATLVGNTAGATVTTQVIPPGTYLWQRNTHDEYPVVFAQNEGFVVRSVQVPGTGTWTASVQVEWAELASF
jgi:hypothetical protein